MDGMNQNDNTINEHENHNREGQSPPQQGNMQQQSSTQQQYAYGNYNVPQPLQKKAPILGTISVVLAFIAIMVSVFLPVAGIVLCILMITLDIIALVRKEKAIALPIIGIVLGTLVIMVSGNLLLNDIEEQEDVLQSVEGQDVFSGRIFIMSDGSALYLQEDGTYSWYQDNAVQDNNYYAGTFKVYNANAAEDYIVTDLSEYGIDEDDLNDFYQRTSDDELYAKENLYCIAMNCNYRLVAGEESTDEESMTPYYGFSDGTSYDLANMNTGNYLTVTSVEHIEGNHWVK